jgi:hypothetical protein
MKLTEPDVENTAEQQTELLDIGRADPVGKPSTQKRASKRTHSEYADRPTGLGNCEIQLMREVEAEEKDHHHPSRVD